MVGFLVAKGKLKQPIFSKLPCKIATSALRLSQLLFP